MVLDQNRSAKAAAFFDLDRTLMAGSSSFHFGRAIYKAGFMTRRQLAKDMFEHVKFRLRGTTDEFTEALRERVLSSIAGRKVIELARLSPDILAGILPRVYPQMLEEVHRHQDAGRPAYIATAAAQEMSELLAQTLAMDGAIGTRAEVVDGVYTGRLAGPFTYGEGKAEALREFAAGNEIDLEQSYAYSDAASDLPMLRVVGRPVAVNPDRELVTIARQEGWEIMRFERLGRRLAIGATTLIAAAAGGSGTLLLARRNRSLWRRIRRRPRRSRSLTGSLPRGIPRGLLARR